MSTQLQVYDGQFNARQIEIMRKTVAAGVAPEDFALFLEVCKHRKLNPLNREIYAISRYDYNSNSNKMTIQVSIDGLRLLAERSGKYKGQHGPMWCGEDGVWTEVWLKKTPPAAAKVGIIRSDFVEPVWAIARYDSYVQTKKDGTPTAMWLKMADVLLAKCAESLGFRKAFPGEIAGLYTHEEMAQADREERPLPTVTLEQEAVLVVDGDVIEEQPINVSEQAQAQSDSLRSMLSKSRTRAYKLGIKEQKDWIAFCADVTGKEPDALTLDDLPKLNGTLTQREQGQAPVQQAS